MKAVGLYSKCQNYFKSHLKLLRVTKTMGVYIGHPLCETIIKPNILAKTRDKEVINQNEVGLH